MNYWIQAHNIADDLLVIASDNYFEFDLGQFIAAYNYKSALVAIYNINDKNKARQFGVARLDGNKIFELEEKPAKPKSSLVATACYILPPKVFPLLSQYCDRGKKDNLGGFISYLIDKDEVHAYTFSELWFDIGSIESYRSIQQTSF